MKEPTEGRILLVGEGNFSLSASLVEGGTISGPQMIATCRETFTAVQENHQLAASNIDFLEKAGGTVLFEVDATDLHNHPDINFYHFDRVIFNFPLADRHNIKKNRELLSDFFSSVKNILDPEKGQVMVTLCKGQGGTPADQPMRSWHDSWQVVSMAANAGFILTQIHPFQAEEFVRYKSVGFRFQDKGFHTESALTHVFEAAPTISMPVVNFGRCVMSQTDQQFVVPTYVRRKHDRWSLLDKKGHPVCTLLHHLTTRLSLAFPSLIHLPANSPLLPKVLPGYTSSLRAMPCVRDEVDTNMDSDNGQIDGDVMAPEAEDSDRCQTDDSLTALQADAGDCELQGPCSKERKELENRQKVAVGPGQGVTDGHTSTACDDKATGGSDAAASDGNQSTDRVVPLQPFRHGVDREGVEGEGTLGIADSSRPTFPPLSSPVFVLHTVSQPDPSQAGHNFSEGSSEGDDRPSHLSSCALITSERQAEDAGDSKVAAETMETGDCNASDSGGDFSQAKRSKIEADSTQSSVTTPGSTLFHLRCSLLENLTHFQHHMETKSRTGVLTSGIVYRRCPVCPSELAASHEVLVLTETEDGTDELRNQLSTALKAVMDKDSAAGLSTARMAKCVKVVESGSLNVDMAFTVQTKGAHSFATLGHTFTFDAGQHHGSEEGSDPARKPMSGAILYLDTILLHALRLPDVRLLWSEDKRFLGQFSQTDNPLTSFSTFRPFSLYPVRFVHDVSFWENPQRVFEEEEFMDVVREVADDTVTSVSLVDCFDQADSGKTSRCYRLVFQSHDHALSYITSWRLQSVLRLKVAQRLGVTLR
ncbi:ferredoxin-fold anticodon-binding domain-containing protein 1 homolog [Babylonia areolata]|uniref:ferredoxin-fold anticodon-binding domain-containing protein 1 homolog n=1 Tax=Babylonia areolata TaxID=304850 RepID=UPI003FD20A4E